MYYVYKHATDTEEAPQAVPEGVSPQDAAAEVTGHPEALAPLHFQRSADDPRMGLVFAQLVVSLGVMLGGAYLFVEVVDTGGVSYLVYVAYLVVAVIQPA